MVSLHLVKARSKLNGPRYLMCFPDPVDLGLKNVIRKKIYMYVPSFSNMLTYLAVMCFLFIYKSLSGAAISSKIWASQARKNCQAKLSMGSC